MTQQQAGMSTTADLETLQQHMRQDIADTFQRVREEMHTSMADLIQPAAFLQVPCRGSQQVLQKQPSRTGSATWYRRVGTAAMTKVSSGTSWQSCTSGCMPGQTWVSEFLVRVQSVDKVERSTLAADCTDVDFRTFETALHQILHRTATNNH